MIAVKKLHEEKEKNICMYSSRKIHIPGTHTGRGTPLNALTSSCEGITTDMIVFEGYCTRCRKIFYSKSKRIISTRSNKRQKVEEVSEIEPKE
jgi:hypothetical protein